MNDRVEAIREAAAKAARDKRRRELRVGAADICTGHYRGRHGAFFLRWIAEEYGYRKEVEQHNAWHWEDPTILSTADVEQRIASGEWRRALPEQNTYPGPLTKMVRAARNGPLTKKESAQHPRFQASRSEAHGHQAGQSAKFSEAPK
jgi:hypothetical protein